MRKSIKISLSLLLTFMLLILGVCGVSAEADGKTVKDSIIYFEVPESWTEYEKIYCYTNIYNNAESLVKWHSEETECVKVSDGLYSYDLSKVCTIEDDKYYIVIFSSDNYDETLDILLSTESIGDTVYCEDTVIESPNGSTYNSAHWKNTTPVVYGDANLDTKLNVKDATYIQKYLAKIELRSEHWEPILDANHDGRITISDVTTLQKHLAKIEI